MKTKSLQKKLEELDAITKWFENDTGDIEEAIKQFEQGLIIVDDIKTQLSTMENKIISIKKINGDSHH